MAELKISKQPEQAKMITFTFLMKSYMEIISVCDNIAFGSKQLNK